MLFLKEVGKSERCEETLVTILEDMKNINDQREMITQFTYSIFNKISYLILLRWGIPATSYISLYIHVTYKKLKKKSYYPLYYIVLQKQIIIVA